MNVYKVKVTLTTYALAQAETPEAARAAIDENLGDIIDQSDFDEEHTAVGVATPFGKNDEMPQGWERDCIPWGPAARDPASLGELFDEGEWAPGYCGTHECMLSDPECDCPPAPAGTQEGL